MLKKIIRLFVFTIFSLLFLTTALFIYQRYENKNDNFMVKTKPVNNINLRADDIESSNEIRGLIFIGNKKNIDKAYLTKLNKKKAKLRLYELPNEMMFEVSNSLYREIRASFIEYPQLVKLSKLYSYAPNKTGLEIAVLGLEDYLNLGLSFFIFFEDEVANGIFDFSNDEMVFTKDFKELIRGSKKEVRSFVKKIYNKEYTNLSVKQCIRLLYEIVAIETNSIQLKKIDGQRINNGIKINKEDLGDFDDSKDS